MKPDDIKGSALEELIKRRRKRRRLQDILINEVSFVDKPAVPESEFLIIKRLDEQRQREEQILRNRQYILERIDAARDELSLDRAARELDRRDAIHSAFRSDLREARRQLAELKAECCD